jgi:hypothetical protein
LAIIVCIEVLGKPNWWGRFRAKIDQKNKLENTVARIKNKFVLEVVVTVN